MNSIAKLFAQLDGDAWRISHPFNDDMLQANALLHNTAATDDEMVDCLALWCQHRQPCQFGRAAASRRRIHFCFLRETALQEWNDSEIANKIAEESDCGSKGQHLIETGPLTASSSWLHLHG